MLVPVAATLIADLIKKGFIPRNATVVEMGNQTYSVDGKTINSIIEKFDDSALKSYGINKDQLVKLSKAKAASTPKEYGVPLAKDFFKALGFSSYEAIDINSDFGSMVMDLNKNLKADYGFIKTYDLVTNIGVSEHLFDQANFIKNAHNLCKKDGVMLHILPFIEYINHGFFNYQPRLFFDLAIVNNYDIVGLYVGDRNRIVMDLLKKTENAIHFYQYTRMLASSEYGNMFVIALLRKTQDSEFVIPLQGKYMKDLEGDELEDRYEKLSLYKESAPNKGFFAVPTSNLSLKTIPKKLRMKIKNVILYSAYRISRFVLERF